MSLIIERTVNYDQVKRHLNKEESKTKSSGFGYLLASLYTILMLLFMALIFSGPMYIPS